MKLSFSPSSRDNLYFY